MIIHTSPWVFLFLFVCLKEDTVTGLHFFYRCWEYVNKCQKSHLQGYVSNLPVPFYPAESLVPSLVSLDHQFHLLLLQLYSEVKEIMNNIGMIKQVVVPKGLDISHPTTEVMSNHIGFTQLFSQETESVAEALSDSNRQDSIFSKKLEAACFQNSIHLLWILAIYTYTASFMQIQQSFRSRWF